MVSQPASSHADGPPASTSTTTDPNSAAVALHDDTDESGNAHDRSIGQNNGKSDDSIGSIVGADKDDKQNAEDAVKALQDEEEDLGRDIQHGEIPDVNNGDESTEGGLEVQISGTGSKDGRENASGHKALDAAVKKMTADVDHQKRTFAWLALLEKDFAAVGLPAFFLDLDSTGLKVSLRHDVVLTRTL